jgi:potassium/hydrogen antiporter
VTEPLLTAFLLAVFGLLLAISVLSTRATDRIGVPVVLVFLVLGMLAGSEGIGGIAFENYQLAFRLGTIALVLILFDAGLHTSFANIRRAVLPASALATVGVGATAGLVAVAARALGLGWGEALLLGAIVSSTDAATVFAVLRGSRLHLKPRVGSILGTGIGPQ